MPYKVAANSILMPTECSEGFSCLSFDDTCLCEVERYTGGKSGDLIIKPINVMKYCNYKKYFPYSFVCNCPTRKEI
jgi:hypothetical protein